MKSNKSNKFNAAWQLARVQARDIKNVDDKILFVMTYVSNNITNQDIMRVMNWLKMTRVAYKDDVVRYKFEGAIKNLEKMVPKTEDNGCLVSDLSDVEIDMIFKDLSKRKYNFQFKKVPVAHTKFMNDLHEEISARLL